MSRTACPTHPRYSADDCPLCEKAIEREEWRRQHGSADDDWREGQDRYERWLDEIGGSR